MRRFPMVFLAISAVAATACTSEGGPPPGPATVNVHVFCDDATGPGIGARVNPWRAHTRGARQVTFNIRPTPGTETVTVKLDSVPGRLWAFQDTTYQPRDTSFAAPVSASMIGDEFLTYYRLTLRCQNDTIVIDPIVIVDE